MNRITGICRYLRREMTMAEKVFWEHARERQISGYKIARQYPIIFDYEDKKGFFVADFYCRKLKLIIEIDGSIHNTKEQRERDLYRDFLCRKLGHQVLRFTNEEVLNNTEKTILSLQELIKFIEGKTAKTFFKRKDSK